MERKRNQSCSDASLSFGVYSMDWNVRHRSRGDISHQLVLIPLHNRTDVFYLFDRVNKFLSCLPSHNKPKCILPTFLKKFTKEKIYVIVLIVLFYNSHTHLHSQNTVSRIIFLKSLPHYIYFTQHILPFLCVINRISSFRCFPRKTCKVFAKTNKGYKL